MTRMMKLSSWAAAGCLAVAAMMGCQNNATTKPAESANGVRSDVTDIRPMESTAPAYQPVAYQPTPTAAPDTTGAPAAAAPVAAAGNTHVVKRGETLYSIAKASYGDGKQWQKIASANPGVSPSTLKVGQTLVIP